LVFFRFRLSPQPNSGDKHISSEDPFHEFRESEKALRARLHAPVIPLFGASTSDDTSTRAWLNPIFDDDSTEAFGYRDAACLLVDAVARGASHADWLAYPIVFCYRHYVELMLKSILLSAVAAEYVSPETFTKHKYSHNLSVLWGLVRPALVKYDESLANDAFTRRVANRISELTQFDPDSLAYRYRLSRSGKPRRLPDEAPFIDLRAFCEGMNDVATYLDRWWDEWGRIVEFTAEMNALYRDDFGP
jgi:hypothetical protein